MSPPVALSTKRPADAFRAAAAAENELSDACPRDRAAAALDWILKRRSHGSVEELLAPLGVSRGTIRNWRRNSVDFSVAVVWAIAHVYAADRLPKTPDELDALMAAGPSDDVDTLFNLFYDDNDRAAFEWIHRHRPANFRWNTEYPAA